MDVQDPKLALARVPETVNGPDRHGNPRPRGGANDLIADRELGLTFEHVEGIDMVLVLVWLDRESRPEPGVDYLEFG